MLDQLIGPLAKSLGIEPSVVSSLVGMVSKMLLQKEDPNLASNLLSNLPSDITDLFSNEEKQQFTTSKQDLSLDNILESIGGLLGTKDKDKALKAAEETANILGRETGDNQLVNRFLGEIKRV